MIIQELKKLVFQLYVPLKISIGTTEIKAMIKINLLIVLRHEIQVRHGLCT